MCPGGHFVAVQSRRCWGLTIVSRRTLPPSPRHVRYVIASPRACDIGCADDKASLPDDPLGFAHYYMQQLKAIDWAKTVPDDVFKTVNFTAGVGIAGHSMGGQATVFSASYQNASDHGIKAAVMHHAFTHEYPGPSIPFLAMTGAVHCAALNVFPIWSLS
jgi:hypothetical protein